MENVTFETTVDNTETSSATSELTESQMSVISRLSLRDNVLLILKSEDRWFGFDELHKAAVDLKLDKGEAPSERGMKISLSRLSNPDSNDSIFVSDSTGYFYTYRGCNPGTPPTAPSAWKSGSKRTQTTGKGVGISIAGRPSSVPLVEYSKVARAVVNGRSVPNARVREARNSAAAQIAEFLGTKLTNDEIVDCLVQWETKLQSEADSVVKSE
jgi:hypothetical protein